LLIRPKLLLTLLGLCLTPLLLLGVFNYINGLRAAESALLRGLEGELDTFIAAVSDSLDDQENGLVTLARSPALCEYVCPQGNRSAADDALRAANLKVKLASVLHNRSPLIRISFFDQQKQPVFLAERRTNEQANPDLFFINKEFPPGQARPDEKVWAANVSEVVRSQILIDSSGASIRFTVPVIFRDGEVEISKGALVGELSLDSLLSEAAQKRELDESTSANTKSRTVVVIDDSGRILYHPNPALLHQSVDDSMPYFKPAAIRMIASEAGWQSFISSTGDEVWTSFDAFPDLNMSVAIRESYNQAMAEARRAGVWGLIYAVLIGLATLILLTSYVQRRTGGIERVSEGVAAIAEGKLDHRIELRSSDENRVLADNVNLMTDRLREQIARETEARQFESFVKLSAMLTHDLKNAIEALSLIVGNMEKHFDNEDFRADAMNSLKLATQNLSAMVARLTNPVTTLSGEHKRPRPVDIIPMLRRVLAITAGPVRETHKIEAELPTSLFALVDGERIEKVIENLVLNALEAMTGKNGTLTIEAGTTDDQKVFFSVTDSGMGMTPAFMEKRLYRPFATTKKKGVGLGLYTCREVVRANGGSIEVNSKQGAGTTFRVVLPSPK
jgi:signal transduction histidine kinase